MFGKGQPDAMCVIAAGGSVWERREVRAENQTKKNGLQVSDMWQMSSLFINKRDEMKKSKKTAKKRLNQHPQMTVPARAKRRIRANSTRPCGQFDKLFLSLFLLFSMLTGLPACLLADFCVKRCKIVCERLFTFFNCFR